MRPLLDVTVDQPDREDVRRRRERHVEGLLRAFSARARAAVVHRVRSVKRRAPVGTDDRLYSRAFRAGTRIVPPTRGASRGVQCRARRRRVSSVTIFLSRGRARRRGCEARARREDALEWDDGEGCVRERATGETRSAFERPSR